VHSGTVPVSLDGLGMPVDGNSMFLRRAFQQVASDPDFVPGPTGALGEDLKFPLAHHDLGVDTFDVEAARSVTVPIQITVGDEAEDGDKLSIMISVASQLSNQEKQQSFVIEVEQGFTDRLSSAFVKLWYIFVFLGLVIVIGTVTYYRQEDDWDEDYSDDSEGDQPPPESDDEWDDWN